jgi:DNA modification methylase
LKRFPNFSFKKFKNRLSRFWHPTEKNLEMLRTIIATLSTEDSIVLDCFAGSGTTLVAADQLNRSWVGIDASTALRSRSNPRLAGSRGGWSQRRQASSPRHVLYLAA